jgi:hypothetical protein
MGHHIFLRISEDTRNILKNQCSVVAKHSAETKHSTYFDRIVVIANIKAYCSLIIIMETIEIS